MKKYVFILGRKHLLSIAELAQVLGEEKVIETNREALIASLPSDFESIDPQAFLNRLGGTVKIAEIFEEIPSSQKDTISDVLANRLQEKFKGATSKINYGISAYSIKGRHDQFLRKTLKNLKIKLTNFGLKSRFINKNFTNPENAALKGEKILEEGAELIVVEGRSQFYIAQTVALQDFSSYSKRDYDRPARDARLGMLPPKLCQIMINLNGMAGFENESSDEMPTIYDPFCGIGTVLTEALNMGYGAIGSDIDPKVIEKSHTNIEYLGQLIKAQKAPISNQIEKTSTKLPYYCLFTKDATQLEASDIPKPIDAIVTESYLGPPFSKMPTPENVEKTFNNIKTIVFGFLKAIGQIIPKGTPVILCVPVYRDKERYHFIDGFTEMIPRLGYTMEPLIPDHLAQKEGLRIFQRPSLVYDRPDQIVGREIWKLVKQ